MTQQAKEKLDEQHVRISTTVGYFTEYIQGLASYRDEGKLIFKDSMLFGKVEHPSSAAMCISKVSGQALNSFKLHNTEVLKVGVEFEQVLDKMKGVSSQSELVVKCPAKVKSTNMIVLEVVDENLTFNQALVDGAAKVPDISPIKHSTRVVVSGKDIKKVIKHSSKIVDVSTGEIALETKDGALAVKAEGDVGESFHKKFLQTGPSEKLDNHETKIGLTFLDGIKKTLGGADEVTIHIKDSHPLRLDVPLDSDGDAQIIFIMAPRIDPDK